MSDTTPTYYGRNVVKPSPFEWKTAAYIFLGGLSGAAAIIGALADATGDRRNDGVVANARYLTLPGMTVGPALLIAALHTPARFYNMLRIVRPTSPMSIGSYTLTSFGVVAGSMATAQMAADRGYRARRIARVLNVPAALLGAVMATYTGALLAATSNPLWSAAPRLLAARFGSAATAAAAASLALAERWQGRSISAGRLERLAMLAVAAELAIAKASDHRYHEAQVDAPLRAGSLAAPYHWLVERAGTVAPLGLHLANRLLSVRRSAGFGLLAIPANVGIIVGSLALRLTILAAGNKSALRPEDYLRLTSNRETTQF